MPDWNLPDNEATPVAGVYPNVPDPEELRWLIDELNLNEFDAQEVSGQLAAAQAMHFANGLASVGAGFQIDATAIQDILADRAGDIDWHSWTGRHTGTVSGKPNEQIWYPSKPFGLGLELQLADFIKPKHHGKTTHGYNVTYADGLHAGYDRKNTRVSGVHLGFGRRVGAHDVIVWLLPEGDDPAERFLEVVGPDDSEGRVIRRTAVSSNGSTWGSWRVHPISDRGAVV